MNHPRRTRTETRAAVRPALLRGGKQGGAHLLGRCPQAHGGVLLWALGLHGALLLGLVVAALRRRP